MNKVEPSRSDKHYRESLNRLPQLADAAIRLSLAEEIEKLRAAPGWQDASGRSSATLVKHEDFRVVLTLMKQGGRISHHRARGSISIQTILGKVRLLVSGCDVCELGAGDVLALQSNLEHDVEALEESAFLLTMAGTDSVQGNP
jgi:quercetin dioxygenase-like cupin family protein